MQQWLKDTECQLLASKAVGGLPDTAREQLGTHLVCIYDSKRPAADCKLEHIITPNTGLFWLTVIKITV